MAVIEEKRAPETVPLKFLDKVGEGLAWDSVLGPDEIRTLVQLPLPAIYEACPRKLQLPPSHDGERLEKLIEDRVVTEEAFCRAIFGGFESIPKQSVVFQNPKTKKIISSSDFSALSSKYSYPMIKKYLNFMQAHSHCVKTEEEYMELGRDFHHTNDIL